MDNSISLIIIVVHVTVVHMPIDIVCERYRKQIRIQLSLAILSN